jgi:hypothetical protein
MCLVMMTISACSMAISSGNQATAQDKLQEWNVPAFPPVYREEYSQIMAKRLEMSNQ